MRESGSRMGDSSTMWDWRFPAVFVSLAAFVVFLPSVKNGFTGWDDGAYITTNPNMEGLDGLARIWVTAESEQYYPLTFTSYWIEYQFWGRSPLGYHVTSVILHAVNTCLMLLFLRRLGLSPWAASAAALFFAVHPVQVMSVAWIPGRKNLLSCMFALVACLAWLRFRRGKVERWYVLSILAFAAGILSKSAVVVLPVSLALIDRLFLDLPWKRIWLRAVPMLGLAAISILLTMSFEQKFLVDPPELPIRLLVAFAAIPFYLYKLLIPINLSPMYRLWDVSISQTIWYIPVVAIALVGILAWRVRCRERLSAYGMGHFVLYLLPALGIVPFGNLAVTYVSDHYLYMACIGVFIVAAVWLDRLAGGGRVYRHATTTLVVVLGVMLGYLSVGYSSVFADARSMWRRALRDNPECYPAHAGLGQYHAGRGDWNAALEHYRRAAAVMPELVEAHVALGNAQIRMGEYVGAEEAFTHATTLRVDHPAALFGLAVVAERTGESQKAMDFYKRTLAADPTYCKARLPLAAEAVRRGAYDEAAAQCRQALADCPNEPTAYLGLATCQRRQRRFGEAVSTLRQGLGVAPDDVRLLNFLARILATAPEDEVRDGAEAVSLGERACELTEYRRHGTLDTLAAAYAEAGRFDEALDTIARAATLARAASETSVERMLFERAAQYNRRQPLREVAVPLP